MCGITGFFDPRGQTPDADAVLRAMSDSLAHRGPDDSGTWHDSESGVGLGHRRLSIIDLSPLGRQPMASACGRWVIAYNGEVYNHPELRRELEACGHAFRGGSDTETMLAAIAQWGLVPALGRFVGMFAFALWDREKRELHLVRDRLGIKPLYVGRAGSALVFGSELKALRAHPGFEPRVDRDALCLYFRHNYIPAPQCIYQGTRKLEPGTVATFRGAADPDIHLWWSAREVWLKGATDPFPGDEAEAVDELERLLADAVGGRMLADVPLGAFLSGGIDSSTVVALMQARSPRPVKTFCIGFHEGDYNEAAHARDVAAHLGTDHTELMLTPQDLLDVVPDIPRYWDEPFADSSQIPTYCVSRLARQAVTVSLSGDGGDELFIGYNRYFWLGWWNTLRLIPAPARRGTARLLRALPPKLFDMLGRIGPKLRWRLDMLGMRHFADFYRYFLSHFKHPADIVLGGQEPLTALMDPANNLGCDPQRQMAFWDVLGYLPGDILTKVDRASMAVGLEARVPLLDHRVVEFAARIPTAMHAHGSTGKRLLRRVLHRHVPKELVERPKTGFGVPIEHWLRHELRDWCEALLDEGRIREQGYLDASAVRRMWEDYLAGQRNWHYYLWDVLMFQAWLEASGDAPGG